MSRRTIPALAALTLTTTACGTADPAIGDWVGTSYSYSYNGSPFQTDLPFVYTYYDGSTATQSIDLAFPEEGNVSMGVSWAYSDSPADDYTNSYTGPATNIERGLWDVVLTNGSGTIDLTCTAADDGSRLDCDGTFDGTPFEFDFAPVLEGG